MVPLALLAILSISFLVRATRLSYDLPELYEEATPMRVAWEMGPWEGRPATGNPGFFHYPSLLFYVHFAAQRGAYEIERLRGDVASPAEFAASYARDPTPFVLLGRWISVAFGVATVLVTYFAGRAVAGSATGLLAAGLLALARDAVATSRLVVVDAPLAFFVALVMWSSVRLVERPSLGRWIAAGCFVGLAASSKYSGALAGVALATAASTRLGASPRRSLGFLAVAALAAILVFIATSPYCLLDWRTFIADFGTERRHMASGHFGLSRGGALDLYVASMWRSFPVLLPLGLVGIARMRSDPASRRRVAPLFVLLLALLATMSAWAMYAVHYFVPAFPAIAVLIALGVTTVWSRLGGERAGRARAFGRGALGTLVGLGLIAASVGLARERARERDPHTRTEAKQWLRAHVPPGSVVLLEQGSAEFRGKNPTPEGFSAVPLPISVLSPEVSAVFYEPVWAAGADFVVLSRFVEDRFRRESERFGNVLAFYDSLRARWKPVHASNPTFRGPAIEVLENPLPRGARALPVIDTSTREALLRCPRSLVTSFLGGLAAASHTAGDPERALALYQAELLLFPDEELALADFGALAVALGRHEEARAALEGAVRRNPSRAASWNNLGISRLALGDRPGARTAFERALAIEPSNERARHNLAIVRSEDDTRQGLSSP